MRYPPPQWERVQLMSQLRGGDVLCVEEHVVHHRSGREWTDRSYRCVCVTPGETDTLVKLVKLKLRATKWDVDVLDPLETPMWKLNEKYWPPETAALRIKSVMTGVIKIDNRKG